MLADSQSCNDNDWIKNHDYCPDPNTAWDRPYNGWDVFAVMSIGLWFILSIILIIIFIVYLTPVRGTGQSLPNLVIDCVSNGLFVNFVIGFGILISMALVLGAAGSDHYEKLVDGNGDSTQYYGVVKIHYDQSGQSDQTYDDYCGEFDSTTETNDVLRCRASQSSVYLCLFYTILALVLMLSALTLIIVRIVIRRRPITHLAYNLCTTAAVLLTTVIFTWVTGFNITWKKLIDEQNDEQKLILGFGSDNDYSLKFDEGLGLILTATILMWIVTVVMFLNIKESSDVESEPLRPDSDFDINLNEHSQLQPKAKQKSKPFKPKKNELKISSVYDEDY